MNTTHTQHSPFRGRLFYSWGRPKTPRKLQAFRAKQKTVEENWNERWDQFKRAKTLKLVAKRLPENSLIGAALLQNDALVSYRSWFSELFIALYIVSQSQSVLSIKCTCSVTQGHSLPSLQRVVFTACQRGGSWVCCWLQTWATVHIRLSFHSDLCRSVLLHRFLLPDQQRRGVVLVGGRPVKRAVISLLKPPAAWKDINHLPSDPPRDRGLGGE